MVIKSTVPVGTADKVKAVIRKSQKRSIPFDLVSNPEFLREGEAINDFMVPDRIVVGVESERAKQHMLSIYRAIERAGRPILVTDIKSAELIKYASNAMLAARISFMNQLSHLCEKIGADIRLVAKGMGLDDRIGPRFLHAGIGYGGSCFPKDVKALIYSMSEHDCPAEILESVDSVNNRQKFFVVEKVLSEFNQDIKGKHFAVWGLSFKPKTDDMREAPSIIVINELQKQGAKISAFDPVAEENAKKIFKDVRYTASPYDALKGADALIICTEWDEFRIPDYPRMKRLMKRPLIFDGRNIYDSAEVKRNGFRYHGVGRGDAV